jgi:hypothetical protein
VVKTIPSNGRRGRDLIKREENVMTCFSGKRGRITVGKHPGADSVLYVGPRVEKARKEEVEEWAGEGEGTMAKKSC